MPGEVKTCSKCGEVKPIDRFYLHTGKPRADCKDCGREYDRAWRAANRDKKREYDRRYREKYPEKVVENNRRRYAEERDKVRASNKAWYERNRERQIVKAREWAAANPLKAKQVQARHREKRRGVPYTPAGRDYMEILYCDPCCYCGARKVGIDHIVPIASGGDGDWDNLTSACQPCNSSKNTKTLLGFLDNQLMRAGLSVAA